MPVAATLKVAVCPAVTVWLAGEVVICGVVGPLLDELDALDELDELDALDELDELAGLDELDALDELVELDALVDAVLVRGSDPGETPLLPPQAEMSARVRINPVL